MKQKKFSRGAGWPWVEGHSLWSRLTGVGSGSGRWVNLVPCSIGTYRVCAKPGRSIVGSVNRDNFFHMNNTCRENFSPHKQALTIIVTITVRKVIMIITAVIIIKQKVHLFSLRCKYCLSFSHCEVQIQTVITKILKVHPYSSSTLACQDT